MTKVVACCIGLMAALAPAVAAQTPSEDSVAGAGVLNTGVTVTIDARSGPSGENPRGTIAGVADLFRFSGVVACLHVDGNTAIVGANTDQGPAVFRFTDGSPDTTSVVVLTRPVELGDCLAPFTGPSPGASFISGGIVVTDAHPLPTRRDQCKNGGWRMYSVFRTQGDCVSFVATGGENQPGGP